MCTATFEVVSGSEINLGKPELVPVGTVPEVEELAQILGCKVFSLPMKYLGLQLAARLKSKVIWDTILEKVERHSMGCIKIYLFKGGRFTLVKSTF